MSQNAKKALVSILGGIGLIILLVGLLTKLYPFSIGLIVAISIWIVTGAVSTMIGIKNKERKRQMDTPLYDSRCREAFKKISSEGKKPGHY